MLPRALKDRSRYVNVVLTFNELHKSAAPSRRIMFQPLCVVQNKRDIKQSKKNNITCIFEMIIFSHTTQNAIIRIGKATCCTIIVYLISVT